jgi:hypothetical protein
MRRSTLLAAILALAFLGTTAQAASVHFKGGRNAGPSFSDNGLTLTASGALAGLGNQDLFIGLSATGNPTATCTNPSGSNQPPGQNPAPVTTAGSLEILSDEIEKNGSVPFSVTTDPPVTPVAGAPDCPNPRWTEEITDMAFTSAVITVEQPVGTVVLTASCTFSSPTEDGSVPRNQVSCS